ncbi:MAG: DUF1007 family protein [Pseudomonadota bacterium]
MARWVTAAATILVTGIAFCKPAFAHPHVFAEARLEVVASATGQLEELRHVWRFDELFTSTVIFEFDENLNNKLDGGELAEVASVVTTSIADFGYFQSVSVKGEDMTIAPVDDMLVDVVGGQLIMLFTSKTVETVDLADNPSFSVYDPTFYTSIEFYTDEDMQLVNAPGGCGFEKIVPDPDEAIAQNQQSLTDAWFSDPEGNDLSRIFATRMEVSCSPAG